MQRPVFHDYQEIPGRVFDQLDVRHRVAVDQQQVGEQLDARLVAQLAVLDDLDAGGDGEANGARRDGPGGRAKSRGQRISPYGRNDMAGTPRGGRSARPVISNEVRNLP